MESESESVEQGAFTDEEDLKQEDPVSDEDAPEDHQSQIRAYNTLLSSFEHPLDVHRKRKRRRLEIDSTIEPESNDHEGEGNLDTNIMEEGHSNEDDQVDDEDQEVMGNLDEDGSAGDPFEAHFANPDDNKLSVRLKSVQAGEWKVDKGTSNRGLSVFASTPRCVTTNGLRKSDIGTLGDLYLKKRLTSAVEKNLASFDSTQQDIAAYLTSYSDLMYGARTVENAANLRQIVCLHILNHVLKGRDKVIKNNERLARAGGTEDVDTRDQGFVRPKVLILTETRQMCYNYASAIIDLFNPEQQENKQRFESTFSANSSDKRNMPEDFDELFGGNIDNNFMTAIKLTRKTLKFFSAFYTSDIILASPLGLRRVLENEDPKKRDHDFLSSIEVVVADQADSMQMQNWENVESVFQHLNLELKEAHGCDFSRVRSYYLDGHAKYLRQSIVLAGYVTPEMNRLFNGSMQNIAGKVKFTGAHPHGAISAVSNIGGIKQTFSRFSSPSPASDPDARFKYFTTAVLPSLLRLPKPQEGGQGILIFIPSYYDFLRLRNHFATSTQTQNVSFGTVHEYSDVSEQRRARAHFVSGRHSFLLYTQRAHHFFRLRLKGVRRVVMYGLPDNSIFYEEIVGSFLDTSLKYGTVAEGDAVARTMFSKWEALALDRVVGNDRVKGMLAGTGDTFEFL